MKSKQADTRFPLHDLIAARWSPRSFTEKPISLDEIGSLMEAARWAPSSFNEQSWHFIMARKEEKEAFARILECLVEENRAWAKNAPLLMISVAKTKYSLNDKPYHHARHDLGLAVENMVLQALSMGLHVHQMGGFSQKRAHKLLDIPEDFDPVTAIAVGHMGDPSQLTGKLEESERTTRTRRPLEAFAFHGKWKNPIDFGKK